MEEMNVIEKWNGLIGGKFRSFLLDCVYAYIRLTGPSYFLVACLDGP